MTKRERAFYYDCEYPLHHDFHDCKECGLPLRGEYRASCRCHYRDVKRICGEHQFDYLPYTKESRRICYIPAAIQCWECDSFVCLDTYEKYALKVTVHGFTPRTAYQYVSSIREQVLAFYLIMNRVGVKLPAEIVVMILEIYRAQY